MHKHHGVTGIPSVVDVLAGYESLVEVGVGARADVAGALAARGCSVTATDVAVRSVPAGVSFVVDDVTDPVLDVYEGADAVYARRLPPELQRPVREAADAVDADCLFTTLGGDPVVVPAAPKTVASGTLYVAARP